MRRQLVPNLRNVFLVVLGIGIPWSGAWSACTSTLDSGTAHALLVCDSAEDAIVVTQESGFWKHDLPPSAVGFDNALDWDSSPVHGDLSVVSGTLEIQLMNNPKLTFGDGAVGAVDMIGSVGLSGTGGLLIFNSSHSQRNAGYFLDDGSALGTMIAGNLTIRNVVAELSILVLTGSGDGQITVASTYIHDPLTIIGGAGAADSVSIGSGRVSKVHSDVTVQNVSRVVVDDRDETQPRSVELNVDEGVVEITGLTAARVRWFQVPITSVQLGSGDDEVAILGTHGTTQLNLGEGDDYCLIPTNVLESGSSNTFAGGIGKDRFEVNNFASSADRIDVSGDLPDEEPGDTLTYSGNGPATDDGQVITPTDPAAAPIHYASIEQLTLLNVDNGDRIFLGDFD